MRKAGKTFHPEIKKERITELYWCGGEPLMWQIHWKAMSRIVELNYADQVLARYNSNLSRINYFGKNVHGDYQSGFGVLAINTSKQKYKQSLTVSLIVQCFIYFYDNQFVMFF